MYTEGQGVAQDYPEAVRWFRKSADQGHADAQFNLGIMYEKGQGVQQDDKEAARWCLLAADQGDAAAQLKLGAMYYEGKGVPQDYIQARMWFGLAGASGEAGGIKNQDIVAGKMTPDQIAEAQRRAREWKPKPGLQTAVPHATITTHGGDCTLTLTLRSSKFASDRARMEKLGATENEAAKF